MGYSRSRYQNRIRQMARVGQVRATPLHEKRAEGTVFWSSPFLRIELTSADGSKITSITCLPTYESKRPTVRTRARTQ